MLFQKGFQPVLCVLWISSSCRLSYKSHVIRFVTRCNAVKPTHFHKKESLLGYIWTKKTRTHKTNDTAATCINKTFCKYLVFFRKSLLCLGFWKCSVCFLTRIKDQGHLNVHKEQTRLKSLSVSKAEQELFQTGMCRLMNLVQTHKCSLLIMGLHIFQIKLC